MTDAATILTYGGPVRPWRPGLGYAAIALVNLASLGVTIFFAATGIVGDYSSGLVGLVGGLPFTAVTAVGGTLPTIIYVAYTWTAGRRLWLVVLTVLGVLALMAAATLTALCLFAPKTHGTVC